MTRPPDPAPHSEELLVARIRAGLRAAADPARAPGMQRYMRSALPCLGVAVPEVRRLTRAALAEHGIDRLPPLVRIVGALWDGAAYREERYAATAICATPAARRLRSPVLLPLYRRLIVTGAWWDHVDDLAPRVGELLAGWPERIRPAVLCWASTDDRWLRRAAITCQLRARAATDTALLAGVIEAGAADPDVFVRKAIGWALRTYARTDEAWVRAFLDSHDLSALSRREARRHLSA